jgi:ribosome maturation factor RimP
VTTSERVRELVEPVVTGAGLDLYDVEHTGGAVRVLVDRSGGVGLDELADLTRRVSRLLDDHDPIPGRYTLEVSSPGLERPLRTPAHFAGAIGASVTVKTLPGTEGDRRVRGTLVAAGTDSFTVRLAEATAGGAGDGTDEDDHDGAPNAERTLRYDEVERARTVFEWGPAPKPNRGGTRTKKRKAATR